jgi:hypothetical protein
MISRTDSPGTPPGSPPRAVAITLPTLDAPCITVGCTRCAEHMSAELSADGLVAAQTFLRLHGPCLAGPDC